MVSIDSKTMIQLMKNHQKETFVMVSIDSKTFVMVSIDSKTFVMVSIDSKNDDAIDEKPSQIFLTDLKIKFKKNHYKYFFWMVYVYLNK